MKAGKGLGRREFLGSIAAGACGGVVALTTPKSGPAAEPIERGGAAHFKFSLAAYSYRQLLQGDGGPRLTLLDFVDDCADLGLEGTELTSYYFPDPLTTDYLIQLKRHCFRQGLDVSGTAVGNDFGHPPGEKRTQEIASLKRWIERADVLGAPVIRIFAGHRQNGMSEEESHKLMVEGMQECCDHAGQHGIHLALENHGGPTATVDGLLALVREVESPWFGVNLDTGNFRGADVYGDLARAAPYALNVQVKVVISGADGKRQPTDYARLARILRGANYRGYIVLEYEEQGDPREQCRVHLDRLREAFGT